MGLFNRKKKKNKEKFVVIDPELDIEAEFRKRRENADTKTDVQFERIETLQYVGTQCQVMKESSKYIGELKAEYQVVNSYINDIRTIESQDKQVAAKITKSASEIVQLKEKRQKLRTAPPRLKHSQYTMLERYENEFPKGLSDFQNDEKYMDVVKHDIRVLEAEKLSLSEDIDNYQIKRNNIRNITVISLIGILAVFVIFFSTGQLKSKNGMTLFMIVLLLAALYVFLIFIALRRMAYKFKLAEKKKKRAVTLLNKTKIKYVNIVNSVDYKREKYGVRNSYELGRIYEIYLEEKKLNDSFKKSSIEIEEACNNFEHIMQSLNLYDASVWSAQLDAILDDKVMKKLRASLNERRQNLRDRIDYNMTRIETSKNSITDIVKKHPELADDIMEIVDSYDAE